LKIDAFRRLAASFGLVLCALTAPASAQIFSAETRISAIQGPSYTPHIAADAANNLLHVAWWEDALSTGGAGEIFYARSNNNGATWGAPVNLSNNLARTDVLPQIAAGPLFGGSGSGAYVFWTDNADGDGNIYLRRSVDGGQTWQAEQPISPAAGFSRPGSALVDTQGRVHFAWYDSRTTGVGQAFYTVSCDNGATWSPAQFVTRRHENDLAHLQEGPAAAPASRRGCDDRAGGEHGSLVRTGTLQ